jgi:hypothetical protein
MILLNTVTDAVKRLGLALYFAMTVNTITRMECVAIKDQLIIPSIKGMMIGVKRQYPRENKMTKQQILPTLLIIIDVGAAIGYFPDDWRKVVYWLAAAALTYVVTF